MLRDVSQCNAYNYGDTRYWDARYIQEGGSFDRCYSSLRPFVRKYFPSSPSILMVGCGNAAPSSLVKCCSSKNNNNQVVCESARATIRCLRCNSLYNRLDNSPTACSFHGHITGEKGLFALSPPHQGIDGEWSDASGVIVYKWNHKDERPNTGSANWKKRWSCCSEYDESAPPCRRGWHVSYDDGFTLY